MPKDDYQMPEIIPYNFLEHAVVFHIFNWLVMLPIMVLFIPPIFILWLVHVKNCFSNRTTNERFGRSRKRRHLMKNEDGEAVSHTTSILADKLVDEIGGPKQVEGKLQCFKNLNTFCLDSCIADCSKS